MNSKEKKPDAVVFDEEKGKYNANILPYGSNVGAPAIQVEDLSTWKNYHVSKVNHLFESRFEELKKQYVNLMDEFAYNNLIYKASFSFEPILGETYHLYEKDSGESFLSMITPNECNFNHKGSFTLNANNMWVKVS